MTTTGEVESSTTLFIPQLTGLSEMATPKTPTLKTLIAQYPELNDSSPKEQDFQYQAYLLYLTGMTLEELDAYFNINDDVGQQDGGGGGGGADAPRSSFRCCKDFGPSKGCIA